MNRRRIELEDKAKDSVPQSDATTFALSYTVIQSFFYGLMKIKSPETIQYMYIHTVAHQKQPQGHQQEYVDRHNYV